MNAVAPGPVWTPLNPADKEPEQIEKFGSGTPMKRPAQPEEIAPAFVFMAAPIVVVVLVAFTPEGYLSFPTDRWSLRWFYALARYPEFVTAFWRSLGLGDRRGGYPTWIG